MAFFKGSRAGFVVIYLDMVGLKQPARANRWPNVSIFLMKNVLKKEQKNSD
jgi:hypothetical protein